MYLFDFRFNENLKDAVVLNTLGTKRMLDLCTQMIRLKVSQLKTKAKNFAKGIQIWTPSEFWRIHQQLCL